jgi:hypothetical protein
VVEPFTIPVDGNSVNAVLDTTVWMVTGQIVICGVGFDGAGSGPAHFVVDSFGSSITVRLKKLPAVDYPDDLAYPFTIGAGSTVSPSA